MNKIHLLSYSIFAFPLAAYSVFVYLFLPNFYVTNVGYSLTFVGISFMSIRLLDAFQDPIIGKIYDFFGEYNSKRLCLFIFGSVSFVLSFYFLLNPELLNFEYKKYFFILILYFFFLGFSILSISYITIGGRLGNSYQERTLITSFRGVFFILGILFAVILSELLGKRIHFEISYNLFSYLMIFVFILTVPFIKKFYVSPPLIIKKKISNKINYSDKKNFIYLMIVFFVSGVATAIPASVFIFYINDVLKSADSIILFTCLYFFSGVISMGFWNLISKKIGKIKSWILSMFLAILSFFWVFFLNENSVLAFSLICILTGFAFGAEVCIPISILADVIYDKNKNISGGFYFSIWQMVEKSNSAVAIAVAFSFINYFDYIPGTTNNNFSLIFIYSIIPVILKLLSAILLIIFLKNKRISVK